MGGSADHGHSYLYIPATVDRSKPVSVLVFFHGSGGNFKAYTWLLAQLAERRGVVLVAPSYGMGNWNQVDAKHVLDDALGAVSKIVPIDKARIDAVGLSNGGLAVSQLLVLEGSQFRSLVFVSPVFDTELLGSSGSLAGNDRTAVCVLTGHEDDRIPVQYVADQVSRLQRRGVNARVRILDGANHFLFFSHRTEMLDQLDQWLREGR